MNKVLMEDIINISKSEYIDWDFFSNKKILITGATGLIGSLIVRTFLYRNEKYNQNIGLFLVVRDKTEAQKMFESNSLITFLECDIEEFDKLKFNEKIDYIIHGASPTRSKFFVEKPVETLNIAINGTKKILEFARKSNIESMVYLSSMEMYGVINSNKEIKETDLGYINPLDLRSSYSEGKRCCELYSYSYYKEYNVPVKIARIAQTFGPGINKNENRVYKYFLDCIFNKEDIILKSSGSTIINFSYTVDTVVGILCILQKGINGEAYNIVSDGLNMSIFDSALWLVKEFGDGKIKVKINADLQKSAGLAPDNKMILSNNKLKKIGWNYKYSLKDGYKRLINYLIEEKNKELE